MARTNTRIREVDRGATRTLKSMNDFGKHTLKVGVVGDHGQEAHSAGATVVDIASFHEFGQGTVPERSWLRAWFDGKISNIRRDVKKATEQVVKGRLTERAALDLLGARFAGEMQKRIASGIAPPLLEATVRRKLAMGTGGETPLIATGQFRGSISWVVE